MDSTPCGFVTHSGKDCRHEVLAGIDINICQEHLELAAQTYSERRAGAPPTFRLRQPCPKCDLLLFVGDSIGQMKRCLNCGHRETGEVTYVSPVPRVKPGPRPPSVVYYLRFSDRIKIGTSVNVRGRMSVLPNDELLAVEPGSFETEHARHVQFSHLRVTGEWFLAEPDLMAHIEAVRVYAERAKQRSAGQRG